MNIRGRLHSHPNSTYAYYLDQLFHMLIEVLKTVLCQLQQEQFQNPLVIYSRQIFDATLKGIEHVTSCTETNIPTARPRWSFRNINLCSFHLQKKLRIFSHCVLYILFIRNENPVQHYRIYGVLKYFGTRARRTVKIDYRPPMQETGYRHAVESKRRKTCSACFSPKMFRQNVSRVQHPERGEKQNSEKAKKILRTHR